MNGIAQTLESHFAELKRTKLDHIFIRKLSWPMKEKTYTEYFLDSKNVGVCSLWKELTTGVDLIETCRMVVYSDTGSNLLLTSYAT